MHENCAYSCDCPPAESRRWVDAAVHRHLRIGHAATVSAVASSLATTRTAASAAAISAATGAYQPTSSPRGSSSAAQATKMAAQAIATPPSFTALATFATSVATRPVHQYPRRLVRSKGTQQM